MTPAFWAGKRVLLTGHTGFKGSWTSLWLQRLGAKVTGLALEPPTTPSLFVVAGVAQGMRSIIGDIRDRSAVDAAFAEAGPEILLHMAAQPLVRRSYADPVETYATNVMGLLNVLEAARAAKGLRAIVNVTTDKCYENREWHWGYREGEPLGGHDPYSSSKACAEIATASYRRSFFHEAGSPAMATARAGNVIGGGDWAADRLVADIMRAIEAGEPVRIRNPHAIRPWQHVLEPLRGYLMLAERLHGGDRPFADAWNFGPDDTDARPVRWIVDELAKRWPGARYAIDQGQHPHEASYLKLDVSKARAQLGWSPRLDLSGALDRIVEWYRARQEGRDMREVTLAQIAAYEERAG